jgi:hypothetical protein
VTRNAAADKTRREIPFAFRSENVASLAFHRSPHVGKTPNSMSYP